MMKTCRLLFVILLSATLAATAASADGGKIKVSPGKFSRKVPAYFSGFNGNVVTVEGAWTGESFLEKVIELRPANLRFPGGTVANYWDWREGWFVEGWDLPYSWNDAAYNPNYLEGFKGAIDATGAAPVWDLNVLSSSLKEQLAMLRAAEQLGFEVRFVELGNEMYLDWEQYIERFPTPASYGKLAKHWAKRIRKEFPKALIAVIGTAPPQDETRARVRDWNAVVLAKTQKVADALTIHPYAGSGLGRNEEFTDPAVPLSVPFINWEERRGVLDGLPAGIEVWVTEYNMLESEPYVVSGTWAHGLYAATEAMLFLGEKRITMICNHNIGSTNIGAINTRGHAYTFSPNGAVMKLINASMAGRKRARKLEFSPLLTFKDSRGGERPALLGWMFYLGAGKGAILLNLSNKKLTVDMSEVLGDKYGYEQVSGDPLAAYADAAGLKWSSGQKKGEIILPPYSITRVFEDN